MTGPKMGGTCMFKVLMISRITKVLDEFRAQVKKKDPSNTAVMFGEWFFWNELRKLAENKAETMRNKMIDDGILHDPKKFEDAGTYDMGECRAFVSTVKVSEKAKTFSPEALAEHLFKEKKVPKVYTIAAVNMAKVPGNPRRTIEIVER